MFDPNKLRKDFPFFENVRKMQGNNLVYFDNAATTQKPRQVLDSIIQYYSKENANSHRGDYDIAHLVDDKVDKTRDLVSKFLNCDKREVVFTSGTTMSLNLIAYGYGQKFLTKDDEILITQSEHASNVLPWYRLAKELQVKVKNIILDENHYVTLENLKKSITPNTKVIALASITNVLGDERPIKEICAFAHEHNIFVVMDGAQSVPHRKTDVEELDVDFLAFSGHKMCGPTGIGVLYGKKELLNEMEPQNLGGGMNESFDNPAEVYYKELPTRLEAGTPNIAGALGLGAAILYLESIGMDKIAEYERNLRKYAMAKLIKIPHLDIVNIEADSGIIAFNVKDVFSQDVAYYLNKYQICVRAGNHCAKNLKSETGVTNTVRVSLYFYNTESDIDSLVELLSDKEKIVKEML